MKDNFRTEPTKHNLNTESQPVSIRLKNEEIDAIDAIKEFGEFNSRNEVIRHLIQPALAQYVDAINTKSALSGAIVRIQEEMKCNERLAMVRKKANRKAQLVLPNFEVSPA
jgi:metal-responsive CopG/Arc/MetJ family transcriptional regulator